MKKIILVYGSVAGVVIILSMLLGFYLLGDDESKNFSEWLGYLTMIVALSCIFVGIKRYRDQELGGVIRFGTAFLLGLGISVVAGIAYVISWEVHLALTDYAFIGEYTEHVIEQRTAAGITAAELEKLTADMETMKQQYGKLLYRLPMTFLELFPVGLLISVISAALLRNPNVLPASNPTSD